MLLREGVKYSKNLTTFLHITTHTHLVLYKYALFCTQLYALSMHFFSTWLLLHTLSISYMCVCMYACMYVCMILCGNVGMHSSPRDQHLQLVTKVCRERERERESLSLMNKVPLNGEMVGGWVCQDTYHQRQSYYS